MINQAQKSVNEKLYDKGLDTVFNNIEQFRTYPALIETLSSRSRLWALQAAEYYIQTKDFYKAHYCLSRVDKVVKLSEDGARLLNETRKLVITGLWVGKANKGEGGTITMRLTALTGSTFQGVAELQWAMYESPITGGFFDGKELSANLVWQYRTPITGYGDHGIPNEVLGYHPGSSNFTMTGTLENGVLKIAIADARKISHWTLKKKTE